MANEDDKARRAAAPPTSRIGRMLRLGSLAPSALPAALRGAAMQVKASRGGETSDDERARLAADAKKVAEAMLKTLGEMKGLPLKLGQMMSYIDGLAPPGYEERFKHALARLQQKAPPLDPEAARKVIIKDLGEPPEALFASFEREPFAAASIGQVHRAITRAGDHVAVKVQYPGIDRAIENDLKSLSVLEQFASPIARKYHTDTTLDEIRQVFLDELDYGREARMADLFRQLSADLPGVVIPRVHHSLCSRRVLTTDLLDGLTYRDFCEQAPPQARSDAGVVIFAFMFRSLFRYGVLYADPHPGNYRFLHDGRVGFLDFGCVKVLPRELVAGMKRYITAGMDADWRAFDRALVEVLGYDPDDPEGWDLYRSYAIELLLPMTSRSPYQFTPESARETVAFLARGIKKIAFKEGDPLPTMPRPIHMPPDFTFVNRLQWGLTSVLAGLHAEAVFRDIVEPWVRDDQWPLPAH